MARKRSPQPVRRVLTAQRAPRLVKLLNLLAERPQTRAMLMRRLNLDVRGFYRDLQVLRDDFQVRLTLVDHRYGLGESLDDALARLPFPDPQLNFREALQLAEGSTPAHERLRQSIQRLTGKA